MVDLETASDTVDAMHDTRDIAEVGPDRTFPYNPFYIWYEHNSVFARETIIEMTSAISIIFVIILIMMADFLAPIYVLLMVTFTVIGQLASLNFWEEHLNIITMINSLMAIGISVDYSAHFMHAFQFSLGENKVERVVKTFEVVGVGVFTGGLSTFLAILPLSLTSTYFFKTFFKCWFSIVLYGLAHALILLPVILSFVGPNYLEKPEPEAQGNSPKGELEMVPKNHHDNGISPGNEERQELTPKNHHSNEVNPENEEEQEVAPKGHHSNESNPENEEEQEVAPKDLHSNEVNPESEIESVQDN